MSFGRGLVLWAMPVFVSINEYRLTNNDLRSEYIADESLILQNSKIVNRCSIFKTEMFDF